MGHERVGALPRTKRWRDVVSGIADAASVRWECEWAVKRYS